MEETRIGQGMAWHSRAEQDIAVLCPMADQSDTTDFLSRSERRDKLMGEELTCRLKNSYQSPIDVNFGPYLDTPSFWLKFQIA